MINPFKKKDTSFTSPVRGKLVPLSEVKDEVFATGMMGCGFAIIPEHGDLYAPFEATMKAIFPTGHAYGIAGKDGLEVLIHIGVDTVSLNGEGFSSYVTQGESIKQNQKIGSFDIEFIKHNNLDPIVIILFPNLSEVTVNNLQELVKENQVISIQYKA